MIYTYSSSHSLLESLSALFIVKIWKICLWNIDWYTESLFLVMDEFDYYCQLARSNNHNNSVNSSGNRTENRNLLNPKVSETPYRIRSQSVLTTDFENSCKDEIFENRRDSLQPSNFRNRSIKENRSQNSLRHNPENLEVTDEGIKNLYRVRSLKKTPKGVVGIIVFSWNQWELLLLSTFQISKGDSIRNYSNSSLEKEFTYPCKDYHQKLANIKINNPNTFEKKKKDYLHIKQAAIQGESFEHVVEDANPHRHLSNKPKSTSFNIQVVGAPLVGKSSLCEQFLTSECLGNSNVPGNYLCSILQAIIK